MKQAIFVLSIFILLLSVGSGNLFSQNPLAGTWQESTYNIKMVLKADGTYTLQYSNGYGQGRYSYNGQQFCMQDSRGGNPVCYVVVSISPNQVSFRDINGVVMNYRRQGGGTPSNTNSGQVLANHNGYTLTIGHFNAGLGILQFIIGQPVKPSELQELKRTLLKEFQVNPSEVIRQLSSLGQSLQTIRQQTDPYRIGLARQELFTALYVATRHMKESDKPLLIQIMNRYIKVLVYDSANKLALTDKDAVGMMRYLAFTSELAGRKIMLTPDMQRSFTADLANRFASMPLEQKKLLCSASLIWHLMETNWNRLTPAQRQQFRKAYTTQIPAASPNFAPTTGTTYTPPAASVNSKKSMAQQMRDFNAKQNMFNMMNQMNMNSHALSLNIIENIGGTGNYWKVTDY
jgi:hypothetical protein